MKDKKKMSRVEQALETLRDEIKNAILNEEIEMEFTPYDSKDYYAKLYVKFSNVNLLFTIAETYICEHNDLTRGMFPKGSDEFAKLTKLAKKHVKILTKEEKERINNLNAEIENIKRGKGKQ